MIQFTDDDLRLFAEHNGTYNERCLARELLALRQQLRPIPVGERLPGERERVLWHWTVGDREHWQSGHWKPHGYATGQPIVDFEDSTCRELADCDYWLPLPPKPETKNG